MARRPAPLGSGGSGGSGGRVGGRGGSGAAGRAGRDGTGQAGRKRGTLSGPHQAPRTQKPNYQVFLNSF